MDQADLEGTAVNRQDKSCKKCTSEEKDLPSARFDGRSEIAFLIKAGEYACQVRIV